MNASQTEKTPGSAFPNDNNTSKNPPSSSVWGRIVTTIKTALPYIAITAAAAGVGAACAGQLLTGGILCVPLAVIVVSKLYNAYSDQNKTEPPDPATAATKTTKTVKIDKEALIAQLEEKFNKSYAPAYDITYQIIFNDDPEAPSYFYINIDHGELTIGDGKIEQEIGYRKVVMTFSSSDILDQIINEEKTGLVAYNRGELSISGNLGFRGNIGNAGMLPNFFKP